MSESSKRYRLHPEVESEIREQARQYLSTSMTFEMNGKIDPYVSAAERGVISFDDIYFLGIHNAAGSISLENIIETGQATMIEVSTEHGEFTVPAEDDPAFRRLVDDRGNYLVGLIYNITPEQAKDRFYDINRKVTQDHNRSLEGGK